ncbi:alkaline phosphatase PhoX [Sulfurimonas sp. HSL1-2]|uniref:alkaline phosphatase PhoX n=1 Tax=Thiomicrolovo zhangzhouensis TaxID=3131933 RepID=UPI0031F93362
MKFDKTITMLSASAAALLMLSGCTEDGSNGVDGITPNANEATLISFSELSAPVLDEEKSSLRATDSVTYLKTGKTASIGFMKLMATADVNNGETFGLLKDHTDAAISFTDGSPYICNGTNSGDGSGLDHSSILRANGRIFMVNQFECGIGGMYGMELQQNNGTLSVKPDSMQYISQKADFGGWVHCAGMTTPWESHLGSEEYEPDAKKIEDTLDPSTKLTSNSRFNEVTKFYWKDENNANATADNNPYFYGWIPEVKVDASVATPVFDYTKHFSMGRAAWELAYVMPDERTAYLTDDGTNVGFYMYIADAAQDLSAGTLYAAKWIQTSDEGAGKADLMWIKLGHATDAEIRTIVAGEPVFSDIFAYEAPVGDACNPGYTYVNTAMGKECLQVKTGMEKAAAFLETRRFAAMKGATTEFRKEEGVTFDPDHNLLFVAMSEVRKGMTDDAGDIRLSENKCGAVYGLNINGETQTAYDSEQAMIDSNYVVHNMHAVVEGAPASYPEGSAYESYTCAVSGIANPDNVTYLAGQNILTIGEDTGAHPNDFVWAYDVVSEKLTRIISTPYGSETTSPYWERDVKGYDYLTVVTQHPFGEVSTGDVEYGLVGQATDAQKESFVGVVGPFKF